MITASLIPVILASQSAVRRTLLAGAGVAFQALSSGVDEAPIAEALVASGAGPAQVAAELAAAKALAVSASHPHALVIGADQTLEFDGVLHGKAESVDEARARLLAWRGRLHHLHAGVVLARGGEIVWRLTRTSTLTVRAFSDAFLDVYMARAGEALLAAVGGYELEGLGIQLFERVEGDYFAVLGLPMVELLAALRDFGGLEA